MLRAPRRFYQHHKSSLWLRSVTVDVGSSLFATVGTRSPQSLFIAAGATQAPAVAFSTSSSQLLAHSLFLLFNTLGNTSCAINLQSWYYCLLFLLFALVSAATVGGNPHPSRVQRGGCEYSSKKTK